MTKSVLKLTTIQTPLTAVWLILISITALNTAMAESANPTTFITIIVCLTIAFKGPLVADHFMGLRDTNILVRGIVYSYVLIIPSVIALTVSILSEGGQSIIIKS